MRQIYIIAPFFLSFQGFSQLHIKPAGGQGSYLFVADRLLYVEKQKGLSIHTSEANKASIDLADESQLLQGTSNTPNSGEGMISVFQQGNANACTYNYWNAPVTDNSSFSDFANELDNFDQAVFLLDTATGISHDLLKGELTVTLEKGNYSERFITTFSGPDQITPLAELIEAPTDYFIFQNNRSQRLEIFPAAPLPPELIVLYDTQGKK